VSKLVLALESVLFAYFVTVIMACTRLALVWVVAVVSARWCDVGSGGSCDGRGVDYYDSGLLRSALIRFLLLK
jgi:hypothetical protein